MQINAPTRLEREEAKTAACPVRHVWRAIFVGVIAGSEAVRPRRDFSGFHPERSNSKGPGDRRNGRAIIRVLKRDSGLITTSRAPAAIARQPNPRSGRYRGSGDRMDSQVLQELERLTRNAAMRREDLLESGLLRSRRRKLLTITAGVMALTSAATITAFLTNLFGARGMQALAALVALGSGTISLVVTAYYADDEIVGRLAGASKYLGLRDAVYRLAIDPDSTDKQKRKGLAALQSEYTKLDETYSKYFTQGRHGTASPHHLGFDRIAAAAAAKDVQELHRNIDDEPTVR